MTPKSVTHWLRWLKRERRSSAIAPRGFTLLELLVTIVIGGIIATGLLAIVIELLRVNTREESLTQAQQASRRALDYIASDLSEAVYVYANPTTLAAVTAQLTDLPTGAIPVLAFWRLTPIEDITKAPANCKTTFSGNEAKQAECETLKVRHNTYTLVVYLHQQNAAGGIWQGPARIIRYELDRYSNLSNLTERSGYSDPTLGTNSFNGWKKDGTENTNGVAQVLTDLIGPATAAAATCPSNYEKVGSNSKATFYACVTVGGPLGDTPEESVNKSVRVFLQGQGKDNPLLGNAVSQASKFPTLETEVLIRGTLESAPKQ